MRLYCIHVGANFFSLLFLKIKHLEILRKINNKLIHIANIYGNVDLNRIGAILGYLLSLNSFCEDIN